MNALSGEVLQQLALASCSGFGGKDADARVGV